MNPPDHNDSVDIRRQIHELIEKQNALQPAYSKAKVYLSVAKDLKRRLLAKWIYSAPTQISHVIGGPKTVITSETYKTNWAMAQKGYLEEIGAVEVRLSECQQVRDEYEKIQPQLDMLRSELSYVRAMAEMR